MIEVFKELKDKKGIVTGVKHMATYDVETYNTIKGYHKGNYLKTTKGFRRIK